MTETIEATRDRIKKLGDLIDRCKQEPENKELLAELKKALGRSTWNYCFGKKQAQPRASKYSLLTKEIERRLEKTPLYSTNGQGLNAKLIVKYFYPAGSATWLITEGEKQENGDWLLYGLAKTQEWEWGYTMLSDLQKYRGPIRFSGGPMDGKTYNGIKIERDLYAKGTLRENLTAKELEELEFCHIR